MQSRDRSEKLGEQLAWGLQAKSAKWQNNKVKLEMGATPTICRTGPQIEDRYDFVR
jgi:hypothetical protein